jgi:hypothetical protein
VGSLYPVKIVAPLKLTRNFSSSKITSHPALNRTRMPSKDAIFHVRDNMSDQFVGYARDVNITDVC